MVRSIDDTPTVKDQTMKCYHETEESSTQISLADAMIKVSEYHCIDAYQAAMMMQLSSVALPITVMDGTVWLEDDVPVLDIDRVIEDWFTLKAKLVRALHPHQAFTAMIVCNHGYTEKTTIDYRFNLSYENETRGSTAEATFNEFLRRVDWSKANEAKVLAIDHDPIL
jgi:hypothetical protein